MCDLNGEVLVRTPGCPDMDKGPDHAVPWLLDTWTEQLTSLGRDPADVRGAGIGLPGTVEFRRVTSRIHPSSGPGRVWPWLPWSSSTSPSR